MHVKNGYLKTWRKKMSKDLLKEAIRLLKAGKQQFAPHTTNSDVDVFLAKMETYNLDKMEDTELPIHPVCHDCSFEKAIWPSNKRCETCEDGNRYLAKTSSLEGRIQQLEIRVAALEGKND